MEDKDKRRILFINPPSGFLADERVFLPLGLANVAATARADGHDITLTDLAGAKNYEAQALKAVRERGYDAVALTSTSPQFYYAYRIMQAIKSKLPSMKVIIGGSHASMFGAFRSSLTKKFSAVGFKGASLEDRVKDEDPNFAKLEEFDVIAEGEEASLNLALQTTEKWINGGVSEDVDSLPMPARDLFDMKSYLYSPSGEAKFKLDGKPTGSIISQRGCPYGCTFCCGRDSAMYRKVKLPNGKWRAHSPERILAELEYMNQTFGLDNFMFYDDEFNLNPERTISICDKIAGRGYKFRGFVRTNLLMKHPELVEHMKDAGFTELLIGIESGSDRLLNEHIQKGTTTEMNYLALEILAEANMRVKVLTMMGHPSETPSDVMATREWILNAGKKYIAKCGKDSFGFDLTVFQPYAGAPIWDRAERNLGQFSDRYGWIYRTKKDGRIVDPQHGGLYINKIDFSTEQGFCKGVPGEYRAFVRTESIKSEQFVALRDLIDWEIRDKLGLGQIGRK